MTTIQRLLSLTAVLILSASIAGSVSGQVLQVPTSTTDLQPVAADSEPPAGTFFLLSQELGDTDALPLPFDPYQGTIPVYALDLARDIYLVADTPEDYENLQADAAQALSGTAMITASDMADDGDGASLNSLAFGRNDLWLEIICVTNGVAAVNLHGVQTTPGEVYELMSKQDLAADPTWVPEQVLHVVTSQNWISTTVPVLNRTNALFLWARDWTGIWTNGLPEWWMFENFGELNETAAGDFDGDGMSNGTEYTNGTDPNTISFTVSVTNQYVNTSTAQVQFAVSGGVPFGMAVLTDSTNFASGSWIDYNSTAVAVLGTNEGWHQVWLGLRGKTQASQQSWQSIRVKLDTTRPTLAITNPVSMILDHPLLQLQGFASEELFSLSFDLTNSSRYVTNVTALITQDFYDTNQWEYSTNDFQCFDVLLSSGSNVLSLHATDLAGNITTTNLTFIVDFSHRTNLSGLNLFWPQNGTQISGNSITIRGWVEDPAAQIVALTVDSDGTTNSTSGEIDRNGNFYIDDVQLSDGTNGLTLVATDSAGNSAVTNFAVATTNIGLSITGVDVVNQYVYGTIANSGYTIWVNGTNAVQDGSGSWYAQPNVSLTTTFVQARAIPTAGFGGSMSSTNSTEDPPGNNSQSNEAANGGSGNPTSPNAVDSEMSVEPFCYYYMGSWQGTEKQVYSPSSGGQGSYYYSFGNWTSGGGGRGYSTNWQWTAWPPSLLNESYIYFWDHYVPFGWMYSYAVSLVTGQTNWVDSPPQILENWGHSDFSYVSPDGAQTWERNADCEIRMVTGGRPGPDDRDIFLLSGYASGAGTTPASALSEYAISPEAISLGALGRLASDRTLAITLPNGTDIPVTPRVAGVPRQVGFQVLPEKFRLVSQCTTSIPTNQARTTIGVGELVQIFFSPDLPFPAAWSTTGGSLTTTNATATMLVAPSNAANVTVTAIVRGQRRSIKFTVLEPKGIGHAQITDVNHYTVGTAGAGMTIQAWIAPASVSFSRVKIMELGRVSMDATGYFANTNVWPASFLDHGQFGANIWLPLGMDNSFVDFAYSGPCDAPWSPGGSFSWPIPVVWEVGTQIPSSNRPIAWNQDQQFSITSGGTVTVRKFGHSVTRNTNDQITTQ